MCLSYELVRRTTRQAHGNGRDVRQKANDSHLILAIHSFSDWTEISLSHLLDFTC